MIFVLFGVITITFFISHVIPADPVGAIMGPHAPQELIEKTRAKWGLDKPLYEQYSVYVWRLFHGDFGISIRTYRPVIKDLIQFFPATLELATAAALMGIIFGVLLGIISAVKSNRLVDHIVRIFSTMGLSMPVFWLGLLMLLLFYYLLGWLPGPGQLDFHLVRPPRVTGLVTIDSLIAGTPSTFINAIKHLIMPAFILGWFSTAAIARITRSSMLEALREDYVTTARMKGLRETTVIMKHALKNAMLPVITIIGIMYGGLLEGSVLTETIFAWPGLGRYVTSATLAVDFPAVIGATFFIAMTYSLANLIVDLTYAFLNPKIKYE